MLQKNNLTTASVHTTSLGKRMLVGAAIALVLITIFLLQVPHPDPAWGKLWMVRPLIVVPFAGAMGGICFHLMDHLRYKGGWMRILANLLGAVVFIIGLWLGIVLGLDGTLWN